MASIVKRRPLPALVALVALLLLTGLVWWRVLNRSGASSRTAKPCPTITPSVRLAAPESITVAIFNGTTKTGIAGRARTTLISDGFNVPHLASNVSKKRVNKIKLTAEIQYGPTARQGALLLRYYFPGASIVATKTKSKTITVSLGTKYRSVASARAVAVALQKDRTVAGTPTATPSPVITC